jgi:hypothetical protein
MPFDVKAFLDEVLEGSEVTAEKREAIQSVLADEKAAKKLEAGYLRQSEFSKVMNAAEKDKQTAVEQAKAAEKRYNEAYDDIAAKWKAESDRLTRQFEDEKLTRGQLEQKLEALKEKYDIEAADLELERKRETGKEAPKSGISAEEIQKLIDQGVETRLSRSMPNVARFTAEMIDLEKNHKLLFPDKPLNASELLRKAEESGKSVGDTWRETWKVDERITELETEQLAARDKENYEKGLKAGIEKAVQPPGTPQTDLLPIPHRVSAQIAKDGPPKLGTKTSAMQAATQKAVARLAGAQPGAG